MKRVNRLVYTKKYGKIRLMGLDREFVIALKEDNKNFNDSDLLTLSFRDLPKAVRQPKAIIERIKHGDNTLVCIPKRLSLKTLVKERTKHLLLDEWENSEYWVLLVS